MNKARRIKDMYDTIQEQIHGEDHFAQAVLRDRAALGAGNRQQSRIGSFHVGQEHRSALPIMKEMRSLPKLSETELQALSRSQEIQEFPEFWRTGKGNCI
jgi:hypothetical protein